MPSRRSPSDGHLDLHLEDLGVERLAAGAKVVEPDRRVPGPLLVPGPLGLGGGGLDLVVLLLARQPESPSSIPARSTSSWPTRSATRSSSSPSRARSFSWVDERQLLVPVVLVEGLEGGLELQEAGLQGAVALLGHGELGLEGPDRLGELRHLAAPLQGAVPLALQRTAGDHAVRVEDLAVEGDERPRVRPTARSRGRSTGRGR